jgi:glucose-1-phosphate adenylyltransferase
VGEGSVIEDSVVLPNVVIGRDVALRRTVIDKRCRLPDGFRAGFDALRDRARGYHVSERGITLVTPEMLGQSPRPLSGSGVQTALDKIRTGPSS